MVRYAYSRTAWHQSTTKVRQAQFELTLSLGALCTHSVESGGVGKVWQLRLGSM